MAWPSPTKTYHSNTYPAIDPRLPSLSARGKSILITGGGSGIGPEVAKAFAQAGASNIALLGRTAATLARTREEIEQAYRNTQVSTYVADTTDHKSLERAVAAQAKITGVIDVLVANAGFLPQTNSITDSSLEEWYNGFEVNVKGNFNLVRAFVPYAAEDAAVLNITTGVVHLPHMDGSSGYHTSKLAAAKLFDYLHFEHPKFFVLSIHPGVIATAMAEKNDSASKLPLDDSKSWRPSKIFSG
jgi:NAD(P)-dependent dehydrogenase (short-subunit alcohol dehydrogenase family)